MFYMKSFILICCLFFSFQIQAECEKCRKVSQYLNHKIPITFFNLNEYEQPYDEYWKTIGKLEILNDLNNIVYLPD